MVIKNKSYFAFALVMWLLLPFALRAQKAYDAEGTVTSFKSPYESISLMVDDDETEYIIGPATVYLKALKKEDIKVGQKIKIAYVLEDKDYLIKQISVTSSKVNENLQFTGLFEYLDGDIAYVDGKKVKMAPKSVIECPGKKLFKKDCGCEKAKPYRGFDDKNIRLGAFFNVTGKLDKDGIIQASKVTVCRNFITEDEIALRQSIESSYDPKGLIRFKTAAGTKSANALYKGNIKIGSLEYKLYDDIKVQGYINSVGNRIIPAYAQDSLFKDQNQLVYRFYVIDSPIPNAFAYPNGMVFVNTGLLKIMDNEAQLALVLGHEIAHVLYEHSVQRYSKSKIYEGGLFSSAISIFKKKTGLKDSKDGDAKGDEVSSALSSIADKVNPQNLSNLFEKTKETQADRLGLMYMQLAGYNLSEAPKFWLKMKALTADGGFQQKMNKSALSILQSKDMNLEKNIFSQLAGKGIEAVSGTLFDNIYSSHPLSTKRYDDINELLITYYKDEDFSKSITGQKEFVKYLGVVRK